MFCKTPIVENILLELLYSSRVCRVHDIGYKSDRANPEQIWEAPHFHLNESQEYRLNLPIPLQIVDIPIRISETGS